MKPPIKRPSYNEHNKNVFTPDDTACMKRNIDPTTYEGIKLSATKVSGWVGVERMPPVV